MLKRTDLALEAKEIWDESAGEKTKLSGVSAKEKIVNGFKVTEVKVLDEEGEEKLCKPIGTYVTIEIDDYIHRREKAFDRCAEAISKELCKLINLNRDATVLVAGLGNKDITPDAIGPQVVKSTLITWHLHDSMPEVFGSFRKVAAMETGVLGTTGIESGELIKALTEKIRPDLIIAVDALACRSKDRLCRTVQISDTGIVPGSGLGKGGVALNKQTLGVPVIAVGVPTVVDAATLAAEIMEQAGFTPDEEKLREFSGNMIVTPKEIDTRTAEISRMTAYGINLAMHEGITVEDITMLIS